MRLVQRRATERAQRFVGREMEVLVEGPSRTDPTRLRGRTRHNKAVNFDGVGEQPVSWSGWRSTTATSTDSGRSVGEAPLSACLADSGAALTEWSSCEPSTRRSGFLDGFTHGHEGPRHFRADRGWQDRGRDRRS